MEDDSLYAALADAFFGATDVAPVTEVVAEPPKQQVPEPDIYAELLSEDKFEELLQNLPDWRQELSVEARARIIERM